MQSKFSEIELTEGKLVSDFIEGEEKNSYMIYAIKGEEIVVNIHVTEGEAEATLTDFAHINFVHKSNDVITFVVPGDHYTKIAEYKKDLKEKIQKKQESMKDIKDLNPE